MKRKLIGWCAVAAIVMAGCSPGQPTTGPISAPADYLFAQNDLADVRTFTDVLAIAVVVSEVVDQPHFDESDSDLIGRTMTLDLARVLWRRPGSAQPVEPIQVRELGFLAYRDGRRRPFVTEAVRLEVGSRYLIPLMRVDGEWSTLPAGIAAAHHGDSLLMAAELRALHPFIGLAGVTADEVGERFGSTLPVVPDSYSDDPNRRMVEWIRVIEAAQPAATP